MISLNKAKLKKIYTIQNIDIKDQKVLRRILELGITKCQQIKILSKSILREVCLVEVRGYVISIKSNILKGIYVKEC